MAWGQRHGVSDWTVRLKENDPGLTSLLLMKNRVMQTSSWQELCDAIAHNHVLSELKASGHKLEPESVTAISDMLKQNKALKRLAIGDSTLGDEGLTLLAPGLAENSALEAIELDYKGITSEGISSLRDVFLKNKGLRWISLSRNTIKDEGLCKLSSIFEETGVNFELLDLSSIEVGDDGMKALGSALLKEGVQVEGLKLADNPLMTGQSATTLWTVLSLPHNQIKHLDLDSCPLVFTDESMSAFSACMSDTNCKLEFLSMKDLQLDSQRAKTIASAVAQCSQLREVRIQNSGLDNEAVQIFAHSSVARDIDLSGNEINGQGLFAVLMSSDCQIVKLGLFNNKLTQGIHLPTKITEEAAKGSSYNCTGTLILTRTAGDVLCSSLKELDLAANNLSEDWMHALLIALRNYPNLLPSLETLVLGVTSHLQNCPVIKYSPGGNENSMSLRENMSDLLSELQLRTVSLHVVCDATSAAQG